VSKDLKLGIIGSSQGNGHPYSWSAIFNGYNQDFMKDCPFPVIHEYLSKQSFPSDCIKNAKVTHIWTQDRKMSEHIASASLIENVVDNYEDMIGQVDAILLARDDSETHFEFAKPFIEAGLPIYIDKPLATSLKEAHKIYALEKYKGQIFTCSAIAYSNELKVNKDIGEIKYIDSRVVKDWQKYSIHIIEPVLSLFDYKAKIVKSTVNSFDENKTVTINWDGGMTTNFKTLGDAKCKIKISLYGTKDILEIEFSDTFNAFKNALTEFVQIVRGEKENHSKEITLKAIEIIERGNIDE